MLGVAGVLGVPEAGIFAVPVGDVSELVFGLGGKILVILAELHSVQPTGQVIAEMHLIGTSVVN